MAPKKQKLINKQPSNAIASGSISFKSKFILLGGLLLSVIIKLYFMAKMGNFDMQQYQAWGNNVLSSNLAIAYSGVYFPIQWQLLTLCTWVGNTFNIFWVIPFKCMNLLFDIAGFAVLVLLLKKYKLNPLYALYYCLHPWFILDFAQGFIDSQFTFFILLTLFILNDKENSLKTYFIAGIVLSCAFLMKPQVMLLFFAIAIYVGWSIYKTGKWRSAAILVPSVLIFWVFNLYMAANRPQIYVDTLEMVIPDVLYLPLSYILIGSAMPCLTASMSNLWYPVAFMLKPPEAPIYTFNIPAINTGMTVFTVGCIILFTVVIARRYQYLLGSKCLFYIFAFVALTVPFIMTSAHCNHPYLATVLLIILLGFMHGNKLLNIAFNGLLLMMFCATFSRYGLGVESPQTILPHNAVNSNAIAILATISFVIVLYYLVKNALFTLSGNNESGTAKSGNKHE